MKVKVEIDPNISELEVIIKCHERGARVEKIISTLAFLNQDIIARQDDKNFVIMLKDVFYFESIDDKVYLYTKSDVYDVKYKLYELEELFGNTNFVRINKSMVLNLKQIKNFKSSINGRMTAQLRNNEMVEISRNYVSSIKKVLGGIA